MNDLVWVLWKPAIYSALEMAVGTGKSTLYKTDS